MSTDPHNLPAARLVPKDRADQMAILRGQASDGARKAGKTAVALGKGLAVLALCAAGLALVGIGGTNRSRSRALDDLDRQMKTLRLLDYKPLPQIDTLELERIRQQLYRDLRNPQGAPYQRYRLEQLELVPEQIHQSR